MLFEMMNEKVKADWVAALRSGKYKQGEEKLRDVEKNEYCCLGVVCDIYDPTQWHIDEDEAVYMFEYEGEFAPDPETLEDEYEDTCSINDLPVRMADKLGIHTNERQMLIAFNDKVRNLYNPSQKHMTFLQIADVIESGVLPAEYARRA
jgi:hypothetical protein